MLQVRKKKKGKNIPKRVGKEVAAKRGTIYGKRMEIQKENMNAEASITGLSNSEFEYIILCQNKMAKNRKRRSDGGN